MAVAFSSSNTTSTVTDNSRTDSRAGTIGDIQSNAQKAIEATGQAYAESKSELRNALDGLKPIALYAALGMALFYALKRK